MGKSSIYTLVAAALLLNSLSLLAHPHVFIDPRVQITINDGILKSFEITWTFDEMTSALCYESFDKNNNKKLDPDELTYIRKDIFPSLAEYDYYTYVKTDNIKLRNIQPDKFTAFFNENKKEILNGGDIRWV